MGWQTARVARPVQILGSLDGIETGIRQLRRNAPLETQEIETDHGALRRVAERIASWNVRGQHGGQSRCGATRSGRVGFSVVSGPCSRLSRADGPS